MPGFPADRPVLLREHDHAVDAVADEGPAKLPVGARREATGIGVHDDRPRPSVGHPLHRPPVRPGAVGVLRRRQVHHGGCSPGPERGRLRLGAGVSRAPNGTVTLMADPPSGFPSARRRSQRIRRRAPLRPMVQPDPHRASKGRSTPGQRAGCSVAVPTVRAGRSAAVGSQPCSEVWGSEVWGSESWGFGRFNRKFCFGAWEGTRTPDLRITNALLYQLSYPGDATDQPT